MKRHESKTQPMRVEFLLEGIRNKLTADEIHEELEWQSFSQPKAEDEGEIRGKESERRVADAVSQLPFVTTVRIAQKNSAYDKRGFDIMATFDGTRVVPSVMIQVKSNAEQIQLARKKKRKQMNKTPEEYLEWCLKKGYMYLNGQLESEAIKRRFLNRLQEIESYHRKEEDS